MDSSPPPWSVGHVISDVHLKGVYGLIIMLVGLNLLA